MAVMSNWSLKRRTLVLALAPAVLMLLVTMAYHVVARLLDAKHELAQSGALMASQLASSADYAVISGNLDSLGGQVQSLLTQPGVVSIRIFDADHRVLLDKHKPGSAKPNELERFLAPIRQEPVQLDRGDWLVNVPDRGEVQVLGEVEVGISPDFILERERSIVFTSLFLGALALAAIALLGSAMARDLENPLRAIIGMVGALKNRHFEARVNVGQDGELGVLAYHLNLLASMLEEHRNLQMKYTEELILSRTRADKANLAKSEFLAMMSHELRTPLNAILGSLQLLSPSRMEDEQKEYAGLAAHAANDLRQLVDDVLDFSKLDEGRLSLQVRPFNPRALLDKLVEDARGEADAKRLGLSFRFEGDAGIWLQGDQVRISQVIRKLLDNALKFTEKGRVDVHLRLTPYSETHAHFQCEIFDTGIGISPTALPMIFEPFMQVDRSHSRRYGGAGLGLSIAGKLTRLMQGDLRVESEPLVGTCFSFELVLPLAPRQGVGEPDAPEAAERPAGYDAHVLVVDDNPANRKVAEAMLKAAGCTVVTASNGREALESLRAGGIDLVLMDCQMPIMDGYEATQAWRAEESGHRLPIVALTANASPDNEVTCLEAGMDAVISKPFRRRQLEMVLSAWLPE